jgi:hypothetical protein
VNEQAHLFAILLKSSFEANGDQSNIEEKEKQPIVML